MKIIIASAYHKVTEIVKSKWILPVQAGRAVSSVKLDMQGDDEGDNISEKNPRYCEMTVMYWLWKNTTADYKGLIHYRRTFTIRKDFIFYRILLRMKFLIRRFSSIWSPYSSMGVKKQYTCRTTTEFERDQKLFSSKIEEILADGVNIVAPHPGRFYFGLKHLLAWHVGAQNLMLLDEIVKKAYPDFYPYYKKSLNGILFYNANMFVMDNDTFNDYCTRIFNILEQHEQALLERGYLYDLSKEKVYSRCTGYMAEMLTNAYIQFSMHNGKKVKILPVAFLDRKIKACKYANPQKNFKLPYYVLNALIYAMPKCIYRSCRNRILKEADSRLDAEYIKKRVDYYCNITEKRPLPADSPTIGQHKYSDHEEKNYIRNSVYFFDSYYVTRFFPDHLKWSLKGGDNNDIMDYPTIVKSRPISYPGTDASNDVVINMDKIRHFLFIKDPYKFRQKKDMAVFRGDVYGKLNRLSFMDKFYNDPMIDAGDTSPRGEVHPKAWHKPTLKLKEHLQYKYIMCLEGTDVASNLKWVMSSNSVAVMPKPVYETWFMEGTLIPNYHYIEVKPDFSDLKERLNYYNEHPEEAEQIVMNAHDYIEQFRDKRREKIIALKVMQKYFEMTGQEL